MSKRAVRWWIFAGLVVASGCMGERGQGKGRDKDPWGGGSDEPQRVADDEEDKSERAASPIGGLSDGWGMLDKIGEGLREPGPYEAPKRSKGFDEGEPHWWVLPLGGPVVEREAYSWDGSEGTELSAVRARLAAAATDSRVLGVLLAFGGIDVSLPDAMELRGSLTALRAAGKRVLCHSHGTGNAEYLVLTACERIGLAPLGEVAITGPAAVPVHLKPLLARFGVVADFVHIGAYKGAAEPFTHDAPSPESREVLAQILDRHYDSMVEVISQGRGIPAPRVRELIDGGLYAPARAVEAKLVDVVTSLEALRDAEIAAPWKVVGVDDEDDEQSPMESMVELMRFLGVQPARRPTHDRVALVYAVGDIIDGRGDGLLGAREQIAAGTLAPALRALAADDSVKAVVLRVDSGGGSAQASELIWAEVSALRAKKPVVVSMSDVAASGGYYISCAANKIYAEPDTLTGSIGVVGGRLAFARALEQQGVRTYPMGRGKRATMAQSLAPWTAEERQVVQRLMEEVYETFLARVAAGRGKSRDEAHAVAQGRVWTGAKAKELGLVDELGGLDAAIAEAERLGKVAPGTEREVYPPEPTLRDLAVSFGQVSVGRLGAAGRAELALRATDAAGALDALGRLEPELADAARRLFGQLLAFRTSAVQAVAFLPRVR